VNTATDKTSSGTATGPQAFHRDRKEAMAVGNLGEDMERLGTPPVSPLLDMGSGAITT
jgi:hypothetical protein